MGTPDRNCINPLDRYPGLSPSLSGLNPGEPLYDFFLPIVKRMEAQYPGILETYEFGFSCVGYARLTVDLFGGPDCARILWVEENNKEDKWTQDWIEHAYVVPVDAPDESEAFNNMGHERYTVGQVKAAGEDRTDEFLATEWGKTMI